jgi:two-component system, OmpR family, response regulator
MGNTGRHERLATVIALLWCQLMVVKSGASAAMPNNTAPIDHGHILVVDDDPQIRLLVSRFLQRHGYRVSSAPDGRVMQEMMARSPVDLVILDVMLPGKNGLDLCREARVSTQVPIIMLTARGDEGDRIAGLEVGADDYVTKPFSSRELLARVRAVLRRMRGRSASSEPTGSDIVAFDGWSLDMRRRELSSPQAVLVDLSTGEFDMLVAFIEHANRVLSREMLMEFAKTRASDPFDRTIDVQVSRLRRKLSDGEEDNRLIKTIRGAGYMFTPKITNGARSDTDIP